LERRQFCSLDDVNSYYDEKKAEFEKEQEKVWAEWKGDRQDYDLQSRIEYRKCMELVVEWP
jgi:hypothetical protein